MTTRAKWTRQYLNVTKGVNALCSVVVKRTSGKTCGQKRHIKVHSITEELFNGRISLYEFWFFKFNYNYFCYW